MTCPHSFPQFHSLPSLVLCPFNSPFTTLPLSLLLLSSLLSFNTVPPLPSVTHPTVPLPTTFLHPLHSPTHHPTSSHHVRAGQGPTSGGHTWLQDPSATVGSDEARRVTSQLMTVLRETWFIGAVGAAGFVALSVFVAVVFYRRKRNEKRAMDGE